MNDEELITAVRQSVTGVHTATPVEQIVSRGRTIRTLRRIPGLAGVLAVAVGAAVAVTALVPSGRPVSQQPNAPLTAWTVVKQADGTVSVTLREFRDAAALQRKLRADGVPASVIFYPTTLKNGVPFRDLFRVKNNPCQELSRQDQLLKVVTGPPPTHLREQSIISVIHPSVIPRSAGVQFIATFNAGDPQSQDQRHALGVWLVQASPQCTGT